MLPHLDMLLQPCSCFCRLQQAVFAEWALAGRLVLVGIGSKKAALCSTFVLGRRLVYMCRTAHTCRANQVLEWLHDNVLTVSCRGVRSLYLGVHCWRKRGFGEGG